MDYADTTERIDDDLTAELLREFARIRELETWNPLAGLDTLPLEPAAQPQNHRLTHPEKSALAPLPQPLPVATVRANLPLALHEYANSKRRSVLLVSAPAGIGKSYSAIQFVQERAALGERWYWAAQNHAMFADLARQPNFQPELWYHWQPMDGTIDDAPACKYPAAQRAWSAKGYKARNLCWWLCGRHAKTESESDTYMAKCPFRTQKEKHKPITFIMHQHLFTGLDDDKADGIVIDESFIGLLAREKYIPGEQIKQGSIDLKVIELANLLYGIWAEIKAGNRKACSGKALLDIIVAGDVYTDACTQLEAMRAAEELKRASKGYRNPAVINPADVDTLQTIYMDELTRALYPEYTAWKAGQSLWAERVWLDRDGLHYVTPAIPWAGMPKKVIVLDATGQAAFYQHVFLKTVEEYRPAVERLGNVYQVCGRMYSKGDVLTRTRVKTDDHRKKYATSESKSTAEFIAAAKAIIAEHGYQAVAAITQMTAEKFIQAGLGLSESDTLHYYKLRGRNDLQGRDCVFIFGTPTPSERTVTNIALALDPRRTEPIYHLDEKGCHEPIYVPVEKEFRLSVGSVSTPRPDTGTMFTTAARVVGCYPDPLLAAIQTQMREAEILQAVYRARLITNPADVWIFSSIPIQDIELDGLYDDPPIAPEGINWRLWLKIRAWHDALETPYGYAEIATGLNISEDYARKLDLVNVISTYFDDRVVTAEKRTEGRQRKVYGKQEVV